MNLLADGTLLHVFTMTTGRTLPPALQLMYFIEEVQ